VNHELNLPGITTAAFHLLQSMPLVSTLLLLMIIDVICGLITSFISKTVSSAVSWRGMSKKVIMLLVVGLAAVLEPFAQGIPLAKLVSLFYIATEALSIMENAAIAGVPLPSVLTEALVKIKESQRARRAERENNKHSGKMELEPTAPGHTREILIKETPTKAKP
jgi:toxin secretion/phage lysis holin